MRKSLKKVELDKSKQGEHYNISSLYKQIHSSTFLKNPFDDLYVSFAEARSTHMLTTKVNKDTFVDQLDETSMDLQVRSRIVKEQLNSLSKMTLQIGRKLETPVMAQKDAETQNVSDGAPAHSASTPHKIQQIVQQWQSFLSDQPFFATAAQTSLNKILPKTLPFTSGHTISSHFTMPIPSPHPSETITTQDFFSSLPSLFWNQDTEKPSFVRNLTFAASGQLVPHGLPQNAPLFDPKEPNIPLSESVLSVLRNISIDGTEIELLDERRGKEREFDEERWNQHKPDYHNEEMPDHLASDSEKDTKIGDESDGWSDFEEPSFFSPTLAFHQPDTSDSPHPTILRDDDGNQGDGTETVMASTQHPLSVHSEHGVVAPLPDITPIFQNLSFLTFSQLAKLRVVPPTSRGRTTKQTNPSAFLISEEKLDLVIARESGKRGQNGEVFSFPLSEPHTLLSASFTLPLLLASSTLSNTLPTNQPQPTLHNHQAISPSSLIPSTPTLTSRIVPSLSTLADANAPPHFLSCPFCLPNGSASFHMHTKHKQPANHSFSFLNSLSFPSQPLSSFPSLALSSLSFSIHPKPFPDTPDPLSPSELPLHQSTLPLLPHHLLLSTPLDARTDAVENAPDFSDSPSPTFGQNVFLDEEDEMMDETDIAADAELVSFLHNTQLNPARHVPPSSASHTAFSTLPSLTVPSLAMSAGGVGQGMGIEGVLGGFLAQMGEEESEYTQRDTTGMMQTVEDWLLSDNSKTKRGKKKNEPDSELSSHSLPITQLEHVLSIAHSDCGSFPSFPAHVSQNTARNAPNAAIVPVRPSSDVGTKNKMTAQECFALFVHTAHHFNTRVILQQHLDEGESQPARQMGIGRAKEKEWVDLFLDDV
ncbi:hypothetical protein BLNAU_17525 [Blattamonas nauphoetae]|uniref:Uncharacterized protein n=1 Tax=Blattamonas nauphoetae TaxID=2049346 RepID=A0ABQ9X6Z6_9EUKA|nr:hypothetical protein BLNAU_17525 [Blattamonas nauphoetae]